MQAACKQGRILSCMLQIFVHLVCLTKGSLSKVMLSVKEERSAGTLDWPLILCPLVLNPTIFNIIRTVDGSIVSSTKCLRVEILF